jgi:hypothetical protein
MIMIEDMSVRFGIQGPPKIHMLAHVPIGEPASISPGHAL